MSGAFLIVEDEPLVAHSIARALGAHAPTHVARSLSQAQPYLERLSELAGVLLDLGLPDGSGLSFLAAVRARSKRLHVTVYTGRIDAALINAVYRLNGAFAVKPMGRGGVSEFVSRCREETHSGGEVLPADAVERFLTRVRLTEPQEEILRLSMQDVSAKDMAEQLSISEHAVKTRVRRLLRRTGHAKMRDLRREVRLSVSED